MIGLGLLILRILIHIMIYMDYAVVALLAYYIAHTRFELHGAFVLLIILGALALLYFINGITVFRVYIFKILGSIFSGWITGFYLIAEFFRDADGYPDRTWQIVLAALCTILILAVRSRKTGLIRRDEPAEVPAYIPDYPYDMSPIIPTEQPGLLPAASVDAASEIAKFKELLDSGAISQEEYDAKKQQLLSL